MNQDYNKDEKEVEKIMQALQEEEFCGEQSITKRERIIKAEPEEELSFDGWREIIKANFPEFLFASEIGLSIIAQILIKDIVNPFALVLVDVPSSGKTITINFFADIDKLTYATDKFTPAAFVTNAANVKRKNLSKVDLLPRLQYTMFLIRDLSVLFSKSEDELNELLGLLTRVLDGEGLATESGIHGQRRYTGEYLFMILAASTPIHPRVWKVMGGLGSRLFFLSMNSKDKSEEELVGQITKTVYKEKENACRLATKNCILTLWQKHTDGIQWNIQNDDIACKMIIVKCAKLLAKLRGVINVWQSRGYQLDKNLDDVTYEYTPPVIEKPDRINQLFYNLARGHALICGRQKISKEDLKPIVEICVDSAPTGRSKLFRALIENGGTMKTSEVEAVLKFSKPTALKEMEALKILDVCDKYQDPEGEVGGAEFKISLRKDFEWFLSDECKKIRGIATFQQVQIPPE